MTQSNSSKAERWIAGIVLILLPVIYFYPATRGNLILAFGDGWSHGIIARMLSGGMIAQGMLPLWNPYAFAGMPLLASIQPGVLYPLNLLFVFLSPGVATNIVVILTYHIALVGTYLYARSISLSRLGSLVAGIAFAFGGFMIAHLDQTNVIAVAGWLPWVLWAVERLFQRCAWDRIAVGATIIAVQFFAGHPQTSFQAALLAGSYFIFSLVFRRPADGRWRFAAATALITLLGGLLCAAQLLPTLELQQQGERAALGYEYFSTLSMSASHLLTLVFPFFFGGGYGPLYKVSGWQWQYWWLAKWAFGYAGMTGLLLVGTAMYAPLERRFVWFWSAVALVAMLLAQGAYLPLEWNRWLYRVPVYNLFRGWYRHLLEVNFALAMLAGFGAHTLFAIDAAAARRAWRCGGLSAAGLVAVVTCIYLSMPKLITGQYSPPEHSNSLTNAEAFVPLFCFLLAVLVTFWLWRRRSLFSYAALLLLFVLDLASFGWFSHWRVMGARSTSTLADPPVIKAIKEREHDMNSFRVLSHTVRVTGASYEQLNHQNMAMVRGVQSVNGYDPFRLERFSPLAGNMDISGMVTDKGAFGLSHQGLNLLNVKYLIYEPRAPFDPKREPTVSYDGVMFQALPLSLRFNPSSRAIAWESNTTATELALISNLANSGAIANNTLLATLRFYTAEGKIFERELRAGRDTSEWAYDRADVRASIQHQRAYVAESFQIKEVSGDFDGHRYLARISFERAVIERVELEYLRPDAELTIFRASLFDASTGQADPLNNFSLPHERWQRVASFGTIELYENRRVLPRAWFVSKVTALSESQVLKTIKDGKQPDGQAFDPAQVALLDGECLATNKTPATFESRNEGAQISLTEYQPTSIKLNTRNAQTGFLVLSEVFYPGWEASIDGVRANVCRADYTLRGVWVPSGEHKIEFFYNPASFHRGAGYSGLGVAILLAVAVFGRRLFRSSTTGG